MLLTKEDLRRLPPLGSTENIKTADKVAQVRLFFPSREWEWYLVEYDPKREESFGVVVGFECEWGYFSLKELAEVNIGGMKVERDRHFQPSRIRDLVDKGVLPKDAI